MTVRKQHIVAGIKATYYSAANLRRVDVLVQSREEAFRKEGNGWKLKAINGDAV